MHIPEWRDQVIVASAQISFNFITISSGCNYYFRRFLRGVSSADVTAILRNISS